MFAQFPLKGGKIPKSRLTRAPQRGRRREPDVRDIPKKIRLPTAAQWISLFPFCFISLLPSLLNSFNKIGKNKNNIRFLDFLSYLDKYCYL